jgi:hypothetical protein
MPSSDTTSQAAISSLYAGPSPANTRRNCPARPRAHTWSLHGPPSSSGPWRSGSNTHSSRVPLTAYLRGPSR